MSDQNKANVETVAVTVSAPLAKAILILARADKKRNASQLADALLVQTVRGRINQKRDKANEVYGAKWDDAAQIMTAEKMPLPRVEYVKRAVAELDALIAELSTL